MRFYPAISMLALVAANPVLAQAAPSDPEAAGPDSDQQGTADSERDGVSDDLVNAIVVEAQRLRGQLDVEQAPIAEYTAEDIAAYGASSIEDLLDQLEPSTGSARGRGGGGRPVILVNGVRIGSFREMRSYPPEAIAKVEVFPEEVAQRFGYSPDRRVVNIVLKDNFASREVELEYEQPDRGGFSRNQEEFTLLKIANGGRFNANLEFNDTSRLTESERDLTLVAGSQSDVATDPDPLAYRTLIADSASYEGTLNYARAIGDSGASMSANLTASRSDTLSLSGLDAVTLVAPDGTSAYRTFNAGAPLARDTRTDTLATSGTFTKPVGGFQLTATLDASRTATRSLIDRRADASGLVAAAAAGDLDIFGPLPAVPDAGRDRAESTLWSANSLATLQGALAQLPAGELTTTFDVGYDWKRIESEDTRTDDSLQLTRGDLSGGVNLVVPIASRRTGAWDAIGSLSLNAQAGIDQLSDFGTLHDWSLGLNWQPFEKLNLSATRIWRKVAPGLGALGNPIVQEFNVPVFDYATGDSVLATVTTGGNPQLEAETQADWKFSANWELPFWENSRLQIDYAVNRSHDVALESPAFSSAFEDAFPDRVTRDDAGNLLAIDRRPVTLFQTRSRTLSIGFNTRGQIGPEPERGGSEGASSRVGRDSEGGRGPRSPRPGFDPARFAELREKFCATPEGEMPDLSSLPERIVQRLRGPDGEVSPERVAQLRARLCSEEGAQAGERFAAIRTALCADPPNLDALPAGMLERLRGPDGSIDQKRLASMRERMCKAAGSGQNDERRGGRGGGGPGFRFGRGGNNMDTRPRYFLSVNHSIALENEVLLADGGPLFDQLDGFILSGGAVPKGTTRLEGGLFWQGYGLRLSGNYVGKAEIRGSGASGTGDLFFDDLATVDLRLFADLGQTFKKEDGLLKNFRVSLRADNLFDARRRVVDANGNVPLAYQPYRIDPTGRYIGIELRKLF